MPVFSRYDRLGIFAGKGFRFDGSRCEFKEQLRPVDSHRTGKPGQKLIGLNPLQKLFLCVEVHGTRVVTEGTYRSGNAVPQDYVQAYAWFTVAADQGSMSIAKYRSMLMEEMTPAQIEEGQRLSRDYAEKFGKK